VLAGAISWGVQVPLLGTIFNNLQALVERVPR